MKMRFAAIGGAVTAICLICGCFSHSQTGSPSLFPDNLMGDAYRTYSAWAKSNAGTENWGDHIPPAYWADRIKALHPLRVYSHRANIVVVQKIVGDVEEGKYIYIPVSSYLPQTGDDGFEFTPNPRTGAYDFKRIRSK